MTTAARRGLLWLHRGEDWLLALLVLALVLLAGAQIVLRNFFDTGLSWADPLLRALVLWTGLIGAVTATREDKHICLDVLSRLLRGPPARIARAVTLGFAALVCGLMAWYSVVLVHSEYESGGIAFAGIPAWALEIILPVAFGLMTLRFALHAFSAPLHATEEPGA